MSLRRIEAVKLFNPNLINPDQPTNVAFYGLYDRPLARAVAGSNLRLKPVDYQGVSLKFQPWRSIPEFIGNILGNQWSEGEFSGGLTIVRESGIVTGLETEIQPGRMSRFLDRVSYWDFMDLAKPEDGWYQWVKMVADDGSVVVTQVIGDPNDTNRGDLEEATPELIKSVEQRRPKTLAMALSDERFAKLILAS